MGLFDIYIPSAPIQCPVCGTRFNSFQGKDGPCALLTWEEGRKYPLRQSTGDDDLDYCGLDLERFTLPLVFGFSAFHESGSCTQIAQLNGFCGTDGTWASTTVVGIIALRANGPQFLSDGEVVRLRARYLRANS